MTQTTNNGSPQAENASTGRYCIQVKGELSEDLLAWLGLPAEVDLEQSRTKLFISPSDQAALYGAILRLRDLGLTLLSVELV